jgi:hypothetical protein
LGMWDESAARIGQFEERIEEQIRPFQPVVKTWASLPGIDRVTAWTLVAEMGVDMRQFPTAGHAASWAALCPGQEESAGKRHSGRARRGNVWLRRALTQAAWAARVSKSSYFKAFYHRLAARIGKKRAIIAVAHALLETGYVLLRTGRTFQDLGVDYFNAWIESGSPSGWSNIWKGWDTKSRSDPQPDSSPGPPHPRHDVTGRIFRGAASSCPLGHSASPTSRRTDLTCVTKPAARWPVVSLQFKPGVRWIQVLALSTDLIVGQARPRR